MRKTVLPLLAASTAALLAAAAGLPAPSRAADVVVSAAISLRAPLVESARAFEAAHPGVRVVVNLGGSGLLARQIERGAPVDVFVSASRREVETLARRGLIEPGSERALARNELVLIRPAAQAPPRVESFADLASPRVSRVAVGDPRFVPAGAYARELLEHLGLWAAVAPKAVRATHVRQALEYVARGEAEAGLVYRTEALALPPGRILIVATAPAGSHAPIEYAMALVRGAGPQGGRLIRFLAGDVARASLRRHGFEPIGS